MSAPLYESAALLTFAHLKTALLNGLGEPGFDQYLGKLGRLIAQRRTRTPSNPVLVGPIMNEELARLRRLDVAIGADESLAEFVCAFGDRFREAALEVARLA